MAATPEKVLYAKTACDIPKNKPNYDCGFIDAPAVECVNIVSSIVSENDQITQDAQYEDYINSRGYPVMYYPYLFEIDKMEEIHGEHSAAPYGKPFNLIMVMEVKDAPSWVTINGFDNDENVTAWIHIKTFRQKIDDILRNTPIGYEEYHKCYSRPYWAKDMPFGSQMRYDNIIKAIEPKPKDLFQLTTFGCDREWNRGNRIFEITNVEDEILSENFNVAMGHYVWKITAKRYRYSFETGMSQSDEKSRENYNIGHQGEHGNQQVFDNESIVKVFLGEKKATEFEKAYKHDTEINSKNNFDMTINVPNVYLDDIDDIAKTELEDNTEIADESTSTIDSNGFF